MPMEKPKQEKQELQKTESSQITTPEENVFKPTRKMLKWLETTGEMGFTATLTDIGKKSGIRRETWYFWLNNPGFVKWWDDQWQKSLMASRWKLDQIGL